MAFHGAPVSGGDIAAAGHHIWELDGVALSGLFTLDDCRRPLGQSRTELDHLADSGLNTLQIATSHPRDDVLGCL
jgi:hypothetical protein